MKKRFLDLKLAVKIENQKAYIFKKKADDIYLRMEELKKCKINEVESIMIACKKTEYHVKFQEVAFEKLDSKAFCEVKKALDIA